MSYWIAIFGFIFTNFLYQALNNQLWDSAIERSYFGVLGIASAWAINWMANRRAR